ncbi:MAG: PAS domain-containing protein [Ignavibacteriales bacterium]|nr:PAS domain-containing protein [Ignavibacteriales bacterium]
MKILQAAFFAVFLILIQSRASAQSAVDSLEILDPFTQHDQIRKIINSYFSIWDGGSEILIKKYNEQIAGARKFNSLKDENDALIKSGDLYFRAGLYSTALKNYFLTLKNFESIHDSLNAAFVQIKIGRTYYFSDLGPAEDYIQRGANVLRNAKDTEFLSCAYYAQSTVEKDPAKKILLAKKALELQREVLKKKPDDYKANENLSRYLNAAERYDEALAVAEKIGDKWLTVLYLNNLGYKMVKEGKYRESLNIFFKSLRICKEARLKTFLRNTYENVARAYRFLGNWERSAYYQQLMHFVEESLYTEQFTIQASEFNVKYETGKKELENVYLKKEKETLAENIRVGKLQNILLIISVLFVSIISFSIFLSRRKIKAANILLDKQKEELENLNSELKRSEENLKIAQSTAHLANWEWDFNNDELTFSDELPKIYDVSQEKLKSNFRKIIIEKIHPEDRAQFINYFGSDLKNITNEDREYRILIGNKTKWVRAKRIVLKDSEGRVTKIFGTVQNITTSKEDEEIKIKIAARQSFTKQLIESQEEERKRIAGELHDSIGQDILLIKNRAMLGLQAEIKDEFLLEQLNAINNSASEMLHVVRETAFDLRPAHLERLGLTETIISVLQKIKETTKININHNIENIDDIFPAEKEIYLFRIIQEGINNIIKHSEAANAFVEVSKKNGSLLLNIIDDGKGFEMNADVETSGGFGLNNILSRIEILKGDLEIFSGPAKGTKLGITIPVETND